MSMGGLHFVHFRGRNGKEWVYAGKEAHGCVVEQAGNNGGSLDQPMVVSIEHRSIADTSVLTKPQETQICYWSGRETDNPWGALSGVRCCSRNRTSLSVDSTR